MLFLCLSFVSAKKGFIADSKIHILNESRIIFCWLCPYKKDYCTIQSHCLQICRLNGNRKVNTPWGFSLNSTMCMFIFTFHFLPTASSERALLFDEKQYLLPFVNIWDPMALNISFQMSIIHGLYRVSWDSSQVLMCIISTWHFTLFKICTAIRLKSSLWTVAIVLFSWNKKAVKMWGNRSFEITHTNPSMQAFMLHRTLQHVVR